MNFLRKLLQMGFVRTLLLKLLRHGLTVGGGALAAWLASKNADPTQTASLIQYLVAAGMTAGGLALSAMDANTVDNRIQASAAVGTPVTAAEAKTLVQSGVVAQHDVDQAQADKVKTAIAVADAAAPPDKPALLAALLSGGPK
jgi:hypothetical protein